MGPGEVAAILFGTFAVLVFLRVPVAFALGLAVVPVFFIEPRLTPVLLMREMFKRSVVVLENAKPSGRMPFT
ncbi:MAG: hypothetical protein JKY99_01955 [Rhizobiales bacterium]|nr:hypothetical protein [Hyphomicrobiales bacterium]